ncbi:hypothetical protein [Streptomyces sp. SID5643]|uniref:hypothetical protein n=1 Tax=Streptomyces sp. SID5643 TaxID=2690307 RepID=UPI001371D7C0|nr:hypothetical protein [Streptomyces sp. SID5643]MZF88754.1 hypothetical protein [Streptomyces sp. SID5643]
MRRTGPRLPGLLPVFLATVLAATACTSAGDEPAAPKSRPATTPTGKPDRQHPVAAFLQPGREAVMMTDAAGRIWKAADLPPSTATSSFDTERLPSELLWSPDAGRLAWIDPGGVGQTGQIHLLDVRSGQLASRPCPCAGLGFLGEDAVSLANDGRSLLLFPPSGKARRIALDKRLPPYSQLATGGADDVTLFSLLPEGEDIHRGEGTLVVADREGKVRPLLPDKGTTSFAEAHRQPGGEAVTWADLESSGACWSVQTVQTHPGTPGMGARKRLPDDAAFRHALVEQPRMVTHLAWAGDGLTLTYSALSTCQVMAPERTASYHLRDGRWTYLGGGMLGIAFGAEGRVVRLKDPVYPKGDIADTADPTTGTLTLSTDGRELVLGKGVSLFALTPAESAAARPPRSAAAQPAAGVAAVDDHGARLPAAMRQLARDIANAAARGDSDRLVDLCDPCSAGEHDWIRSDDGPRHVLRAIRTHPMRQPGGDLLYPGLTTCVDEPGKDISCTPQHLHDAAALRLKPGLAPGMEYGGSSYTASDAVSVPLTLHLEKGTARWTGLAAG